MSLVRCAGSVIPAIEKTLCKLSEKVIDIENVHCILWSCVPCYTNTLLYCRLLWMSMSVFKIICRNEPNFPLTVLLDFQFVFINVFCFPFFLSFISLFSLFIFLLFSVISLYLYGRTKKYLHTYILRR